MVIYFLVGWRIIMKINDVVRCRDGSFCIYKYGGLYGFYHKFKYDKEVYLGGLTEEERNKPEKYSEFKLYFNLDDVVSIKEGDETLYEDSDVFKVEYSDLKCIFVKKSAVKSPKKLLDRYNDLIYKQLYQIKKREEILTRLIEARNKVERLGL